LSIWRVLDIMMILMGMFSKYIDHDFEAATFLKG
jgi:hypothetical protein